MMNIYSRDRHSNLTSRSFDQSRSISANESTYNYGRKGERERDNVSVERALTSIPVGSVRVMNDQLSRRYARNSISPTCLPIWYLAPSSMFLRRRRRTGCKTCRTQGTREPSTVSPTPMEPMEEETSEYTRMGKPILDEVITCVLAAWSGEESERKSLHYVKRGSARFLSKAREASLYHQKKKLVVNWRNIHSRSVGRDEEETIRESWKESGS